MHFRVLIAAFVGAISALPLAVVDSQASTATVDIAKRADGSPKFHHHHVAKYHKSRHNEASDSIEIAKRENRTAVLIKIA